ncbi:unnamed protein product, partial [Prorocentrum cordatum]
RSAVPPALLGLLALGRAAGGPEPACAAGAEGRHGPGLARPVLVSNDHGQVLGEWLSLASEASLRGPLAVLHIDAHGDLNIPEAPVPGWAWQLNGSQRQELAGTADLANFQQVAAWAGLVGQVVWIKQGGGVVERSCLELRFDPGSGLFEEDVLEEGTWPEPCSGGGGTGADRYTRYLSVLEVPERALLRSEVAWGIVEQLRAVGPWLLDVDLDFFVWGAAVPGRPPWAEIGPDCHACLRWPETDCAFWRQASGLEDARGSAAPPAPASAEGGGESCAWQAAAAWRQLPQASRGALHGLGWPERLLAAAQTRRERGAEVRVDAAVLGNSSTGCGACWSPWPARRPLSSPSPGRWTPSRAWRTSPCWRRPRWRRSARSGAPGPRPALRTPTAPRPSRSWPRPSTASACPTTPLASRGAARRRGAAALR